MTCVPAHPDCDLLQSRMRLSVEVHYAPQYRHAVLHVTRPDEDSLVPLALPLDAGTVRGLTNALLTVVRDAGVAPRDGGVWPEIPRRRPRDEAPPENLSEVEALGLAALVTGGWTWQERPDLLGFAWFIWESRVRGAFELASAAKMERLADELLTLLRLRADLPW